VRIDVQVIAASVDTLSNSLLSLILTMRSHRFSVVAFVLTSLLAWAAPAAAEGSNQTAPAAPAAATKA